MSSPSPLPTYARQRFSDANQTGVVEAIQVRPAPREAVVGLAEWDLEHNPDHSRSKKRAVTLFQYEHLKAISSFMGHEVTFVQTRRNLCIREFNLETARAARLRIGAAVLEVTGRCHPCARMEQTIGPGGFSAMFGHGGWTARILTPGMIRIGDTVQLG